MVHQTIMKRQPVGLVAFLVMPLVKHVSRHQRNHSVNVVGRNAISVLTATPTVAVDANANANVTVVVQAQTERQEIKAHQAPTALAFSLPENAKLVSATRTMM